MPRRSLAWPPRLAGSRPATEQISPCSKPLTGATSRTTSAPTSWRSSSRPGKPPGRATHPSKTGRARLGSMPSRKQRRRRAKERRHDYEYVYVDDSGEEVEPPPDEGPERGRPRGRSAANGAKTTRAKSKGPIREAKAPSWNRSV